MDAVEQMIAAVNAARRSGRGLRIAGSSSRVALLPGVNGSLLETSEHTGIVQYDPSELVVTVRAGTPLKELLLELDHRDQVLACDPPMWGRGGTVGGAVSAGLSGPGRVWHGAVRDAVLGVQVINGLGERLNFGGQVMKNVAGYDVSRLVTGAWGCLGVILQASLRVAPKWPTVQTVRLAMDDSEALTLCRELARQYLPVSATWSHAGELYIRLSGSDAAVNAARQHIGGDMANDQIWTDVRDMQHAFFRAQPNQQSRLWRLVLPPGAPLLDLTVPQATEWAGGQRWCWSDNSQVVHNHVSQHGGWAWAVGQRFELEPSHRTLMTRIKTAFDPDHVFQSVLDLSDGMADDQVGGDDAN